MGRRHLLAPIVVAAVAVAACGDDDGEATDNANAGSQSGVTAIQTVPELEPVVSDLIASYASASGGQLELTVVPRDQVVDAVSQGAPAIVPGPFLGGVDSDSVVIGRNLGIIAVPAGNPGQVTGLDAFAADAALDTAICGADSPYGNLATVLLEQAGVTSDPARVGVGCDADAVAQVARGDLDAALVFRSFLEIPEGVEIINIPEDQNLVIDLRYAPVGDTEDSEADSFSEFLQSDQATQILTHEGFLP
jgi:molybdate transport system substrate-binding protein